MQPTATASELQRLAQSKLLLGALFVVLFVYQAVGIFPVSPIEGDGIGIANGAAQIASGGLDSASLAYRYNIQSGTYALTVLVQRLTGADSLAALSWLSALSSILFILFSAALLRRLTAYPYAVCGIAVLLFQESFTGGYYANSTVIAAAFTVAALWVASVGNGFSGLIASGVLLGLGAWMRFDSLLIAPGILFLLHRTRWIETISRTALVALVSVVVALGTLYLSGDGIQSILTSASGHRISATELVATADNSLLESSDPRSHLVFFSGVLFVLAVLGLFRLIRRREWVVLGAAVLSIVPFYVVYLGVITSPKYLYYLIPFFGLFVLSGLSWVRALALRQRTAAAAVLLILFVLQYVVGLQVSLANRPYAKIAEPRFLTLFSIDLAVRPIERVSLVLGAGTPVGTVDGYRLLTGTLFAPLFHRHEKGLVNAELGTVYDYFANPTTSSLDVLVTQYYAQQLTLHVLLDAGYDCQRVVPVAGADSSRFTCMRDGYTVALTSYSDKQITRLGEGRVNRGIEKAISLIQAPKLVFVGTNPEQRDRVLEQAADWQRISDLAYEIGLTSSPQ